LFRFVETVVSLCIEDRGPRLRPRCLPQ
jgi:hypothetical protein